MLKLLIALLPLFAFAAEPPEPETKPSVMDRAKKGASDAAEFTGEQFGKVSSALAAARANRESTEWTIVGQYSLFELWTMSRYGLTVGWNRSGSSTYEFEYTRGSLGFGYFGVDIGELAEQRFALNWRSYGRRNSFNFVTGLYYNELEIHIGSKYLTTVANVPEVDLLKLNTIGVSWGIGNRWQTKKGFVWGADWLVVHVPLTVTKEQNKFINETRDPDDRGDVDSGMKVLRRIPALAGLKVQLGFSF